MQKTQIIAPEWANTRSDPTWHATYNVTCSDHACHIAIESRSSIDLVVVKIVDHSTIFGTYARYYVSSPNYGIAIPCIGSLADTSWIIERLVGVGMPTPDAITVAQVLGELGDF